MQKKHRTLLFYIAFIITIFCYSSCTNNNTDISSNSANEQIKHLELSLDKWIEIERLNSGDFISKMKELGLKYHATIDSSDKYNVKFHWEDYVYQNDSATLFSISRMQWDNGNNEIYLSFKSNSNYFKELKERAVNKGIKSCAGSDKELGYKYDDACIFFNDKLEKGMDYYSVDIDN